jgi:DNA-binding FrmR family transcriptional regulator
MHGSLSIGADADSVSVQLSAVSHQLDSLRQRALMRHARQLVNHRNDDMLAPDG